MIDFVAIFDLLVLVSFDRVGFGIRFCGALHWQLAAFVVDSS